MSERYTLDDLTRAADVTVRTVRYYIAEGLLPAPMGGGRAARYSAEHLDRLVIIAALKDRHLPLRKIGEYLELLSADDIALSADEVRTGEHDAGHPAKVARQRSDTAALVGQRFSFDDDQKEDDDATVTNPTFENVSQHRRSLPATPPASSSPLEPESRMLREGPNEPFDALAYIRAVRDAPPLRRPTPPAPPPAPDDDIAWRRMRIGAGAELLIADAQYRRHRRDIDRLIAELRRIIEP